MVEINKALNEALHAPYPLGVGAMSIESLVRRCFGEMEPVAEL
jgi:hypothetical protein